MASGQSAILNRLFPQKHALKAAYNFFNHEKVTITALSNHVCRKTALMSIKHALVIQDTTSLDYSSHSGLLKVNDPDIGPIYNLSVNNPLFGFFLHPGLVVDAASELPVGFSSLEIWNRKFGDPDKYTRGYKSVAFESKESYRWLETLENAQHHLQQAEQITIIGDRESDIYDLFCEHKDRKAHLLFRCSEDRGIYQQEMRLFEYLTTFPVYAHTEIEIEHNKKRQSRKAKLAVRYGKVAITAPKRSAKAKSNPMVEINFVYVHELPETVPEGEDPLIWRIFTTHEVNDAEYALRIITWYKLRWLIEELFRLLKSKGLQIEDAQFAKGAALKKLTILSLNTALLALICKQNRDGKSHLPIENMFNPEEIECLQMLNERFEGKTEIQKNPFTRDSMAFAIWVIARLGGWKGFYKSEDPPGVISFVRGIQAFNNAFEGFLVAKSFFLNQNHNNPNNSA
jgi:hypothetical protein